jgi:Flp pilus assembly protein CpaB
VVEPETLNIGGVFKKSKKSKLQFWITADERRIPVRIKSKVAVGHFIGDLVAVEGI